MNDQDFLAKAIEIGKQKAAPAVLPLTGLYYMQAMNHVPCASRAPLGRIEQIIKE